MPPSLVIERNVPVPMRDGITLRADVYRPSASRQVPAVLCRVPYDISHPLVSRSALDPERAAEAGLACVYQTTRGRYGRGGALVRRVHSVARRDRTAAAPQGDLPRRHRLTVLRELDLPGRRVPSRLQPLLGAAHHESVRNE